MNSGGQPRILLVEDDPGDAGLVRVYLRRAGITNGDSDRLMWVTTLAEALEQAQHFKPDMVLLDLSLPDSVGLPTMSALRAALPNAPIVVLTGRNDPDFALQALEGGAQDYLVKGEFDHDMLSRTVRYALARGQLESQLRLLDAALNAAANSIIITDPEARIEWANPAFAQLTGYPLDEVLGRLPQELIKSGRTPPGLYQSLWQTIRAGHVWHGEINNRRKDGSFYYEDLTITPVTDTQGAIQHFVAIKQDISERKQVELALRESEQRWYLALDGAGQGVWDWNIVTHEVFFSPQWKAMLGYDEQDIGNTIREWEARLHPDDWANCYRNLQRHFSGETLTYRDEHRVLCKDGSYKWVLDQGMVFGWTADHQPLRMVGTHTDISKRKQADEQMRLLAGVFANTHESIIITTVDGLILDVNPAFCEMTGYARGELLGKNFRHSTGLMAGYAPDNALDQNQELRPSLRRPEFDAALWEAMAQNGYWKGEVWNRHKNGAIYPALLTLSAVRDDQGLVRQYIGIAADISVSKRHQRELERMAHYDALTGLPNRLLLADRMRQAIAQAQRSGKLLAVGYLDLDGFKPVNDQYGHEAGDQLLIEIARRLEKAVRVMDTVARLGGDEFVVLLLELTQVGECERVLARILDSLQAPVCLGAETVTVGASIGVCLYPGSCNDDPDGLLRYADQAMYQVKQSGKNRYCFWDAKSLQL